MALYWNVFIIGAFLHIGLLTHAVYQNLYVLSQGLSGKPIFWIIVLFILSSFVSATLGVYGVHTIIGDNYLLQSSVSVIGACVLLYNAYIAFKSAKKCHHTYAKKSGLLVAFSMIWLNPHIYIDMIVISSLSVQYTVDYYLSLILGFGGMSILWFGALGVLTKKMATLFNTKSLHTGMHYVSAGILTLSSIQILLHIVLE